MVNHHANPLPAAEARLIKQVLALFWPSRVDDVEDLSLLRGGYMNRNYLLQGITGCFVLRRYDYNADRVTIRYEHSVLRFLPSRLHKAAIPKPVATNTGDTIAYWRGHHYALFPLLEGAPFNRSDVRLFSEAGRTLAAYHHAVRHYTPKPQQRPTYASVECLDWVARHASGLAHLWAGVSGLPVGTPREQFIHSSIEFLRNEAVCLQQELSVYGYTSLPKLVIHNDFGPQNLLSVGHEVTALLDFDLVTWDARAYDLALALYWFSEDPGLEPPYAVLPGDRAWTLNARQARAVYHAYADSIDPPLAQEEIGLLPALMRVAILWFVVWYLDLRMAGHDWHPEELSGILACQRWFAPSAEAYFSEVLGRSD
jgi:Ser/Thr protein kinase RdoA (MazF antagonist)